MSDNIRVAVRMRPLIERECYAGEKMHWRTDESNKRIIKNADKKEFSFDNVFGESCTNEQVYLQLLKPLVDDAFEGYNGTAFAYGQTSSGKTHTLLGNDSEPGAIQLLVKDIFRRIKKTHHTQHIVSIAFIEIYNERIIDLLSGKSDLSLRANDKGHFQVQDLLHEIVANVQQILTLIEQGIQNRHVGETDMNARSSRGHTIFTIAIESGMLDDNGDPIGVVKTSQLNIVDLAGSEKAHEKTEAMQYKESLNINKSLSTLGKVIRQLTENEKAPHFRDSALTKILKNSLGGNSRTVIIANVTPAALEETHSTLKFAQRAKLVKTCAIINTIASEEGLLKQYEREIRLMKERISELDANKPKDQDAHRLAAENMTLQAQVDEYRNKLDRMSRLILIGGNDQSATMMNNSILSAVSNSNPKRTKHRRQTWAPSAFNLDAGGFYTPVRQPLKQQAMSPVRENDCEPDDRNTSMSVSEWMTPTNHSRALTKRIWDKFAFPIDSLSPGSQIISKKAMRLSEVTSVWPSDERPFSDDVTRRDIPQSTSNDELLVDNQLLSDRLAQLQVCMHCAKASKKTTMCDVAIQSEEARPKFDPLIEPSYIEPSLVFDQTQIATLAITSSAIRQLPQESSYTISTPKNTNASRKRKSFMPNFSPLAASFGNTASKLNTSTSLVEKSPVTDNERTLAEQTFIEQSIASKVSPIIAQQPTIPGYERSVQTTMIDSTNSQLLEELREENARMYELLSGNLQQEVTSEIIKVQTDNAQLRSQILLLTDELQKEREKLRQFKETTENKVNDEKNGFSDAIVKDVNTTSAKLDDKDQIIENLKIQLKIVWEELCQVLEPNELNHTLINLQQVESAINNTLVSLVDPTTLRKENDEHKNVVIQLESQIVATNNESQKTIDDLTSQVEALRQQLANKEVKEKTLTDELVKSKVSTTALDQQHKATMQRLNAERTDALKQLYDVKLQITKLETSCTDAQHMIAQFEAQLAEATSVQASQQEQLKLLKKNLEDAAQVIDERQSILNCKEECIADLEKKIAQFESQLTEMTTALANKQTLVDSLNKKVEDWNQSAGENCAMLMEKDQHIAQMEQMIANLEAQLADATAVQASKQEQLESLKKNLEDSNQVNDERQSMLNDKDKCIADLEKRTALCESKLTEMTTALANKQTLVDSLNKKVEDWNQSAGENCAMLMEKDQHIAQMEQKYAALESQLHERRNANTDSVVAEMQKKLERAYRNINRLKDELSSVAEIEENYTTMLGKFDEEEISHKKQLADQTATIIDLQNEVRRLQYAKPNDQSHLKLAEDLRLKDSELRAALSQITNYKVQLEIVGKQASKHEHTDALNAELKSENKRLRDQLLMRDNVVKKLPPLGAVNSEQMQESFKPSISILSAHTAGLSSSTSSFKSTSSAQQQSVRPPFKVMNKELDCDNTMSTPPRSVTMPTSTKKKHSVRKALSKVVTPLSFRNNKQQESQGDNCENDLNDDKTGFLVMSNTKNVDTATRKPSDKRNNQDNCKQQ